MAETVINFTISGVVVRGNRLGRQLGFPTANVAFDGSSNALITKTLQPGVYSCTVFLPKSRENFNGILHFGPRSTFNDQAFAWEVHIFDFPLEREIYGDELITTVKDFLRPTVKFDPVDELIKQMQLDCAKARELLV